MDTRDEDATQSEVLIWSYEASDVDSGGYVMKVVGVTPGEPPVLWQMNPGREETPVTNSSAWMSLLMRPHES